MSIVKFINVYNDDADVTAETHRYLSDSLKTEQGKWIDSLGFLSDDFLHEIASVKRANQKTHGQQFRQLTVSISPVGNSRSNDDYMAIGRRIGKHYFDKGFQVIIYLHLDTKVRHLHFMLNSVNYKTGKIFTQSRKELNRFKLHCSHVLTDYGLDVINTSTEDVMNMQKYDLKIGFDCLEICDDVLADQARVFEDLYDHGQSYFIQFPMLSQAYACNSEYEINCQNRYYEEEKTMKEESKIIPTGDVEQLPDNIQDRAALNLNFGKEINILVPENSNESCIADLVNSIDTIPEQQRIIDAKIGVAAAAELSSRGMGMPVNVNSLVSINIMFDDVMKSEIFDAIEVSCQEE